MLRNVYDFDCTEETSFWHVIKDTFGGMEELSSKMRNQVRKSLKIYAIRKVTADEILRVGYPIFVSAIENYRVKCAPVSYESFVNMIKNSSSNSYDFWCVFEKETNKAVALSINVVHDDCCEYKTMKADPLFLHNSTYPYYGLIYEMNRFYLEEKKLKYVSDGARSITEHSNIQPFLVDKFKFRKAYCRLQIEYKWWLKLIVRCCYPFRKVIPNLQIVALLKMEAMRRGEY